MQMGKVEDTFLRLPCAPSGFRDADHVHARLFYHFHIGFNAVYRKIFVVVGCAVEKSGCFHRGILSFFVYKRLCNSF